MERWPVELPRPDRGLGGSIVKEQIKTPMEAGYKQTRPRYTRARRKFDLKFSTLRTELYFNVLEPFFVRNSGKKFTYYDPLTKKEYTVMFQDEELLFEDVKEMVGRVRTAVKLEEV